MWISQSEGTETKAGVALQGLSCALEGKREGYGRWEPIQPKSPRRGIRDRNPGSAAQIGIRCLELGQPLEWHVPFWALCFKRDIDQVGIIIATTVIDPC